MFLAPPRNRRVGAAYSTRASHFPVCECRLLAISSGGPSATIRPPRFAALRPQIDHPVGALDHVQVVLDHDQRSAAVDQLLERRQQLRYIVEVQSRRRLVQNVEHAAGLRRLGRRVRRAHRARCAASFTRCASPPESVVADCPSRK